MEKYIYDTSNGLWYELHGDYYIPFLALNDDDVQPVGKWGRRHLNYIREHRPALYTTLLFSGELMGYLAQIDAQATEMFELLMKQMAEKEGITEHLKRQAQLRWVGALNNIRIRAEEIVNSEVVCVDVLV
jgi:hypothetical protein